MQQILQAYAHHHDRWLRDFRRVLSRRAHDPNIWEEGVLDLVSPADLRIRHELGKTETGLPWGGRGDIGLYWRIMYAAYAEYLALADPGVASGEGPRPIMDVVRHCPEVGRDDVLKDIIAAAGHQIRLRSGLSWRPEPLGRFMEVMVGRNAALIVGYAFNGKVLVSRETAPSDAGDLEWKLGMRDGRWCAAVMPWQFSIVR